MTAMPGTPLEQRNEYRGDPARAWLRLELISATGRAREVDLLADTGNPCAVILDTATMEAVRWRESIWTHSNLGPLEGGWLRISIPRLGSDVEKVKVCSARFPAGQASARVVPRARPGWHKNPRLIVPALRAAWAACFVVLHWALLLNSRRAAGGVARRPWPHFGGTAG